MTEAPELMLNLSAWIERRKQDVGPYADHIIHSVSKYEAEIERLRAVAADLPAAETVKPLEWQKVDAQTAWWRADGLGGEYAITWSWNRAGRVLAYPGKNGMERDRFPTLEEAKATAQSDHERRILSCLTTQPDPVKAVARVPAAAVEALAAYQQADPDGVMVLVSRQAIDECLPALRALAEQEQSDE